MFRWKSGDAHNVEIEDYHYGGEMLPNTRIPGKRGVTPETAWLLASALGTTPELWLNLQSNHDLVSTRPKKKIRQLAAAGYPR